MTTTVVHCRREPFDVYIGRPGKWGNPFHLSSELKRGPRAMDDRKRVIDTFEKWVTKQPELMASLHELRGKRLGCYCAPLPCHGDVLARLANA